MNNLKECIRQNKTKKNVLQGRGENKERSKNVNSKMENDPNLHHKKQQYKSQNK